MAKNEDAKPPQKSQLGCHAMLAHVDTTKPLLPRNCKEDCQHKKQWTKVHLGCCGEEDEKQTALFGCGNGVLWNNRQQGCVCCGTCFCIYFVLFGIIQFVCFHWATLSCGALPGDYPYPGGGHGEFDGPSVNLIPRNAIVAEREKMWYGSAFDVYNSTDQGMIAGAPVGTWFRTWGPWFSTYTYQDVQNSKETVYMRPSILGMWFYIETVIFRCDGKGEPMRFTEGSNWMRNRIRRFFGMNQGFSFKLWRAGEMVATAEETYHGAKSCTFRNATAHNQPKFASSVLLGRKMEGKYREWFLQNDWGSTVPFYQTTAVATLFAFHIYNEDAAKKIGQHNRDDHQHPQFLELQEEEESGSVQDQHPEHELEHSADTRLE